MAKSYRFHLNPAAGSGSDVRHITNEEFGRRVYSRMLQHGWNQSDLARAAGLTRDAISTYVRGRSRPSPSNLTKLATALGVEPQELLPNAVESAIRDDTPLMEMKVSPAKPSVAWLRISRLTSTEAATKIMQILVDDHSVDAS